MKKEIHIMVITDEENCPIVRTLLRHQVIPIVRRSIMSAINLLQHLNIIAIIIDKENQNVDSIELILNARDVAGEIPIFVPEQYHQKEDWSIIRNLGKIIVYNDKNYPLNNEIIDLLETQ